MTKPIEHTPHPRADLDSKHQPHPKLVDDVHKHDKLTHGLLDSKTPAQSRVHNLVALHHAGVKALSLTDRGGHAHNLQIRAQELHGKISKISLVEIQQNGSSKSEQTLLAATSSDGAHFQIVSARDSNNGVHHPLHEQVASRTITHHHTSDTRSGRTHVAAGSLPNLSITGEQQSEGKAPLFSAMFNANSGDNGSPVRQASYEVPHNVVAATDHNHPWSASNNSDGTLSFGFSGGFVDTDGAAADKRKDHVAQKQTSLAFSNGAYLNTYTDAFVVFPQSVMDRYGFHIGDAVWLRDDDSGKMVACLIGDVGPEDPSRFGEASIKAWQALDYDVTGNNGPGKSHHFQFIVAPNTGNRKADPLRNGDAVQAMLQKTNTQGSTTA